MEKDSIEVVGHEVALLLRRVEAARKESSQIDRASYLALDALETGGPMSISALAQLFQLDISTLSRQTAALEASGWVERLPDPEDGRVKVLRLTSCGLAQLQASRAVRNRIYGQLLEGWTEEDLRAFGAYLVRFNQAVAERRPLLASAEEEDVNAMNAETG
ncbi:MAG: MarR family transcriptional regulator [Chloroflexota bacterium]